MQFFESLPARQLGHVSVAGQRRRGTEVPEPDPFLMSEAVQQPGEEAPRKRVTGTDLLHHAKAQRGHVDPLATLEAGDRVGVILDNEVLGLREQRPQPRRILSSEHRERFVGANEDDVAAPNVARRAPRPGPIERAPHSAGR